jgi:hypothetical protein
MGMGLAICRSITEAHHGRIVVGQDETELGGALFTVQPLANHPCATARTDPTCPPQPQRHDAPRTASRGHPHR